MKMKTGYGNSKKLKTGFFEKKSKQLPHFCHVKEEKKEKDTNY